jgi:hypothetical protein
MTTRRGFLAALAVPTTGRAGPTWMGLLAGRGVLAGCGADLSVQSQRLGLERPHMLDMRVIFTDIPPGVSR